MNVRSLGSGSIEHATVSLDRPAPYGVQEGWNKECKRLEKEMTDLRQQYEDVVEESARIKSDLMLSVATLEVSRATLQKDVAAGRMHTGTGGNDRKEEGSQAGGVLEGYEEEGNDFKMGLDSLLCIVRAVCEESVERMREAVERLEWGRNVRRSLVFRVAARVFGSL